MDIRLKIQELTKGLNTFNRLKIKVLENERVRFDNNDKTNLNKLDKYCRETHNKTVRKEKIINIIDIYQK
jgi:hypothetical protein